MKHYRTLWVAPLLCSAALIAVPSASYAQGMQQQQPQSQQAPAASPSQMPSSAQPQRDEQRGGATQSGTQSQSQTPPSSSAPSTAQQPSQQRQTQTPSQRQQTQGQAPAGQGTSNQNAQTPQRSGTSQQTQSPATTGRQNAQQPQGGTATQQNAQTPRSGQQPSTGQAAGQSSGATASLTDQQRGNISASVGKANVRPLRNVNFSVNVGATIPSSVRFYPVTRAMIDVYPQYRGYRFVVVNEEIVIVEPRTRRIVTVLPYQAGSGGMAAIRSKLKLSDKQRDMIRSSVRRSSSNAATTGASTTVEDITVGETIPESVMIERFPDTVYREVPAVRSYQYIVRDRGVYVVDPRERRVIDVIE